MENLVYLGVTRKCLRIIYSLYSSIKTCVKYHDGRLSDYFPNDMGLLQGEVLSPILFSMYILIILRLTL